MASVFPFCGLQIWETIVYALTLIFRISSLIAGLHSWNYCFYVTLLKYFTQFLFFFAMTISLSAILGLVNEHYISRSIYFHILIWTLNKKTVPVAYYFVIRLLILILWREEVLVLLSESIEKTYCGSVAVMSPFKFLHTLIYMS